MAEFSYNFGGVYLLCPCRMLVASCLLASLIYHCNGLSHTQVADIIRATVVENVGESTINISRATDSIRSLAKISVTIPINIPDAPNSMHVNCIQGGEDGIVGVTRESVPIFGPFDKLGCSLGEDLVESELCRSVDKERGMRHHSLWCDFQNENENTIIGIALDGYPIRGSHRNDSTRIVRGDLDECNGRINGNGQYGYHLTRDFPYTLGCFKGFLGSSSVHFGHLEIEDVSLSGNESENDEMTTEQAKDDFLMARRLGPMARARMPSAVNRRIVLQGIQVNNTETVTFQDTTVSKLIEVEVSTARKVDMIPRPPLLLRMRAGLRSKREVDEGVISTGSDPKTEDGRPKSTKLDDPLLRNLQINGTTISANDDADNDGMPDGIMSSESEPIQPMSTDDGNKCFFAKDIKKTCSTQFFKEKINNEEESSNGNVNRIAFLMTIIPLLCFAAIGI